MVHCQPYEPLPVVIFDGHRLHSQIGIDVVKPFHDPVPNGHRRTCGIYDTRRRARLELSRGIIAC